MNMKYVLSVIVALLLTALFAHSASAQLAALTNADVTRLVAMRVSDQTVIAVIHEAKAIQFDLSPPAVNDMAVSGVSTAVIATMRLSSTPSANALVAPEQSPAGVQTLAGASAQAGAQAAAAPGVQRPRLSIVGPSSPPALPPASTSEGTKSAATTITTTTTILKDEAYWKGRMRDLQAKLDNDVTVGNEMLKRLGIYNDTLSNSAHVIDEGVYMGRTTQSQTFDTNDELSRAIATVKNDKRVIGDLEEEARHAAVPPGWLR
jgi:hypothetical protein